MLARWLLVIFVLSLHSRIARAAENKGVFDKIKSGLQYATNYLETAKEIADLVSQSLGHGNDRSSNADRDRKNEKKRGEDGGRNEENWKKNSPPPNLVSGFFRLLGLDSPRMAAIAVNSVIFLAQMISSLFDVKPKLEESRARNYRAPFDPMEFIVENQNEKVQDLLRQARDPKLPDELIKKMDGFNTACVRLLICKSSPIILAAQESLRNKTIERRFDLTSWLPNIQDFENNADECEDKHNDCDLFPEERKNR